MYDFDFNFNYFIILHSSLLNHLSTYILYFTLNDIFLVSGFLGDVVGCIIRLIF